MPFPTLPRRPVARSLRPRMRPLFSVVAMAAAAAATVRAADPVPAKAEAESKPAATQPAAAAGGESKPADAGAATLKDATRLPGLFPLWRKDDKLHAELPDSLLGKELFVLTSISRGIGDRSLLGGMSLEFGDDWVWQFRKVDDSIQVVRRNVRFFAAKGSPEAKAVDLAYTDSVLFSLPIKGKGPDGGHLVDLSAIFLTDLPRIAAVLPGFSFARDRSTWGRVKNFPDNVELEVAATYGSSGATTIETVPDSRGVTINVRYSISLLPQNSYTPRLADDRVGYFVTALKDFSQEVDEDRFVRYINRWQLEKADPKADLSPPKKPIVFWIENTVPFRYRPAVRRGIEAWNEAFEKAGFAGAIEVRQQPDKTEWDPEDVNYNTFRWITAGQGFAMGPSRVNPRTGQILDADIIFDADFLQFWRREYETFTPQSVALLTGGGPEAALAGHAGGQHCCGACALFAGHARETALAATALAVTAPGGLSEVEKEKLVVQGLTLVAMHELGHTLGLRHNFKGSALRSLADFNDVDKTRTSGGSTSVMDYIPVNIMPKGKTQGEYYAARIGPYDAWAIEYGYKPVPGGSPQAERPELEKIAARSGEPELAYATDEDTEWGDPDPLSNRFDLGADPIEFARARAELVAQVMPGIVDRMTKDEAGEGGYGRVRQAFGILLSTHGQAMYNAARLVGGLHASRSHKADANAPPPFRVVEPAKQREAVQLLAEKMFSAEPFSFPPELYNQLAATRWLHWGTREVDREDYPVHEVILMWQDRVLGRLLDPLVLERIRDNELKLPADQDAFTTAELFESLDTAVMREVGAIGPADYSARKPAIASLRRGLQRAYVSRLAGLSMAGGAANPDAQALAAEQLRSLDGRIEALLAKDDVKLDAPSRAHLAELRSRIDKVLDAELLLPRP